MPIRGRSLLPRSRRLSPLHFPLVLEEGRLVKDSVVSLKIFDLQDGLASRFGTIISKKISPLAVRRNQLKRRLIKGFEKAETKMLKGWLVLALPSHSSLKASADQINSALRENLARAGLIRE